MSTAAGPRAYWVCTVSLCLPMAVGAALDLLRAERVTEAVEALGFPVYVLTIVGVGKVLGVTAILAPGLPRAKEWAYAGLTINLVGAAASHAFAGDPLSRLLPPLVLLGLCFASWALRPDSRRLRSG